MPTKGALSLTAEKFAVQGQNMHVKLCRIALTDGTLTLDIFQERWSLVTRLLALPKIPRSTRRLTQPRDGDAEDSRKNTVLRSIVVKR